MKTIEGIPTAVGLHSFTAYEGDIELVEDAHTGLMVPSNPVVYQSPTYKNLITTVGKNLILDRLFGLSAAVAITSVGVGTDVTAAAVGQTQLNPTVAGSVLIQTADAGTSRTAQTVSIQSTFGTGVANFQWNEAGLFNGNTNGTSVMFNRVIVGPFSKSSSVSIIYKTTISQS